MVLMDDASYELMATMPNARRMQAEGATYVHAHVVDSLCCPSRASIFTGRPPHQTGVLTNTRQRPERPHRGLRGVRRARQRGDDVQPRAAAKRATPPGSSGSTSTATRRPTAHGVRTAPPRVPGWDHFDAILGGGYPEWDFWSVHRDGTGPTRLTHDVKPPRDSPTDVLDRHYATNVAADDAVDFVRAASGQRVAVLPRGGDLRAARPAAPGLSRQPAVPAGVRGPGPDPVTRAAATAAPSRARRLSLRDLRGTATRAPTTRPRSCTGTAPPRRRRRGTSTRSR